MAVHRVQLGTSAELVLLFKFSLFWGPLLLSTRQAKTKSLFSPLTRRKNRSLQFVLGS